MRKAVLGALSMLFMPSLALASGGETKLLDLTQHWVGWAAISMFVLAYALVILEEKIHLRKSKPVLFAAGAIWIAIAAVYAHNGDNHTAETLVRHNLLEYAELFFFLLVAMTYINALAERGTFDALQSWLVKKQFSYKKVFWLTGILAFFISPVADNLTTALLMCAVVMAVGKDNAKFVALSCINIVVAANAGGAFSPFGDITTLMVWQKGIVDFWTFFNLFLPSVINWLVPAIIMSFAVPSAYPSSSGQEKAIMKRGARRIMLLFGATIALAVSVHQFFHLPPVLGMLTGLSFLKFMGFYLKKTHNNNKDGEDKFNVFKKIERAEWDTLFFFCGVILCVGGLATIGYLSILSNYIYGELGATTANVLVGIASALIDNIPIMFAVLTMQPDMSLGQWLLVTLTAGVGGSLLSIGSAAGVALMGVARGQYTFFSHLKWTWAIALGYALSILCHMWLNAKLF